MRYFPGREVSLAVRTGSVLAYVLCMVCILYNFRHRPKASRDRARYLKHDKLLPVVRKSGDAIEMEMI